MTSDDVEGDLQILDHKLSQLKREYDQYFLGSRPREPALLRGEVQKAVVIFSNTPLLNTALRFKFNSICSRYQAFRRQWDENLRKIESGTYERHRFKAKLHGRGAEPQPEGKAGKAAPRRDAEGAATSPGDEIYQSYVDARLACGQSVKGLTREKLGKVIEQQQAQLRERYGDDARFRFRVAVEKGKVRLKASKLSG